MKQRASRYIGLLLLTLNVCAQPILISPQNETFAGSSLSNLRVTRQSADGSEAVLTVDYTYDGLHGSTARLIEVIADNKQPKASGWFGGDPVTISAGRGTISLKVKFFNDDPGVPAELTTDHVRVMMMADGGKTVISQGIFSRTIKWGGPKTGKSSAPAIEPPPADLAKAGQDAQSKAEAEAKARQEAIQKAEADEKARQEAAAKQLADEKAKADAEAKAREEAILKAEADEKARQEAAAKRLAEERAQAEAEAKAHAEARLKAEADEKAREEAEARRLAQEKAEAQAKADAEAKAEAEAKAREEAIVKAEADEKARQEAAAKQLAEEKAQAEAEAKARETARLKAEADEKAREQSAAQQLAEEKAKAEAEAKAAEEARLKAEAEAKARAEAEAKTREEARLKAEAEIKRLAEAKAKAEAEAKASEEARLKAEAEEKAREEAVTKKLAEEKAQAEADAKARETARLKAEADEKAREEVEAKRLADAKAKAEAAAKALEEVRLKEEAAEKAREEAVAKQLADEKAQAEADAKAREETRLKAEAEEKTREEAETKRLAEERAKAEAAAKALEEVRLKEEAAEKARQESAAGQTPEVTTQPGTKENTAVPAAAQTATAANAPGVASSTAKSKVTNVDVVSRNFDRTQMTIGVEYNYAKDDGPVRMGVEVASTDDPGVSEYFSAPVTEIGTTSRNFAMFPVKIDVAAAQSLKRETLPTDKVRVYLADAAGQKSYVYQGTMMLVWHIPKTVPPSLDSAPAEPPSTVEIESIKQNDFFSGYVTVNYNLRAAEGRLRLRIYDSANPASAAWIASDEVPIKSGPGLELIKVAVPTTAASPDVFTANTLEIQILDAKGAVLSSFRKQSAMSWARPK